jgi:spore germination cell wall hydrolase CwlJ-like protein
MASDVTLPPHHQMLAAAAALIVASGLAIGHVQAETVKTQTGDAQANVPAAPEAVAARVIADDAAAVAKAAEQSAALNERHVNCVAKVVHHEAANQPKTGQIAVAHVLVNRVKAGFADHVCAVANQKGQFFPLHSYHPNKDSRSWAAAVAVARDVLAGKAPDHSNGALFFHANWARLDGFFRTRTKVARVEDHSFYR